MSRSLLIQIGFLAFFIFLAIGILSPNPFGNNPDIIQDESYFLTSSLSAIEKGTLPGFEFSHSGSYYGGPQIYLDTVVLVPVVAVIFIAEHGSRVATEVWVALHTGDLLSLLRLVNGILGLGALAWCVWFFRKKSIPRPLALSLALFLFLLLSTVFCIEFLHTAKVWTIYILTVAVMGAFFLAQEYYLRHYTSAFVEKGTYVALLVWSGVLVFLQNYFGVFSIFLLALYALLLEHIRFSDILQYLKKYWYLVALAVLAQLSFFYRAAFVNGIASFYDLSAKTGTNHIDWIGRLYDPLVYAVTGQPLVVLYLVLVATIAFLFFYQKNFFVDWHRRMLVGIALLNPLAVYLFFHVLIGFSGAPRYGILLTMACSFSIVLLLAEFDIFFTKLALGVSIILFCIINIHAIALYWRPSSETILLGILSTQYNTSNTVFIQDSSAVRLALPTNADSLPLLGDRSDFTRFQFLLQHLDAVRAQVAFRPLTIVTTSSADEAAAIARFSTTTDAVWLITTDCTNLCSAAETGAGTCFSVHLDACGVSPQEVNDLPVFLSSRQLGDAYIVRRVH